MDNLKSFNDINTKVSKLFHNPNINFFIIMCLILLISCYTFINDPLRYSISSFVSNPVVILFILIILIFIGYYNINIAIMILLLFFIALFGANVVSHKNKTNNQYEGFISSKIQSKKSNNLEHFTDTNDESDNDDSDNDDSDNDITNKNNKLLKSNQEENINNIKDVLLGTINKFKDIADTDYKKGLNDNKKIIYKNEKTSNKSKGKNSSKATTYAKTKTSSKSGKEQFQTIKTRSFNPNKEEDTNLLITKEILQDIINRIEYNFETTKYLKKYIKHRIEEVVNINKLLDDDEE